MLKFDLQLNSWLVVFSLRCFTPFPLCFDGSLRLILAAWHIFVLGDLNCPVEVGGDCLTQSLQATNATSNLISGEIRVEPLLQVLLSPKSDTFFFISLWSSWLYLFLEKHSGKNSQALWKALMRKVNNEHIWGSKIRSWLVLRVELLEKAKNKAFGKLRTMSIVA